MGWGFDLGLSDNRAIERRLVFCEAENIFDRDVRNVGEGFGGEEGLVSSDEDVWEGEEASEDVVLKSFLGEVAEEDVFLFLIDV